MYIAHLIHGLYWSYNIKRCQQYRNTCIQCNLIQGAVIWLWNGLLQKKIIIIQLSKGKYTEYGQMYLIFFIIIIKQIQDCSACLLDTFPHFRFYFIQLLSKNQCLKSERFYIFYEFYIYILISAISRTISRPRNRFSNHIFCLL